MPEWAVAVIAGVAAVVLLTVVIVVLLTQKRKRPPVPAQEPAVCDPEPTTPEIPLARQPVAPADQAQGYGWMKASDLANHHNQP